MALLSREGGVLELRVNGVFVMDTVHTTTERELATIGLGLAESPTHVLVGGLGLGFTARACLADPRVERVTVVEIERPVVDWLTEGLVPGGAELITDPRVEVVVADLADHVSETTATYDVLLLDIDNGPGYLVHDQNARVYDQDFLRRLRTALSPGGVVVIWSAAEDPALEQGMAGTFVHSEVVRRAVDLQGRDEHYVLYSGRR